MLIEFKKSNYITSQDGDDLTTTFRFEKQMQVLDAYDEFDIVSSGMAFFDENGYWGEIMSVEVPEVNDFILQSPFCHAPCMIRKKALMDVKGYKIGRASCREREEI